MTHDYYIIDLKTHEIKVVDLMTWAEWFDTANRRVRLTRVGPYYVSTVFLGLDHNWGRSRKPVLFETMVYVEHKHTVELPALPEIGLQARTVERETDFLDEQTRCCTWDEAIAMHENMIAHVRQGNDEIEEIEEELQDLTVDDLVNLMAIPSPGGQE